MGLWRGEVRRTFGMTSGCDDMMRAALVFARCISWALCSMSRKERTMMFVGVEDVMDAGGECGDFEDAAATAD